MALVRGMGSFNLVTRGLVSDILLPVEPMEFSLVGESTSKESTKFVDGLLVTAGTAKASEVFTLTIGIEAVNWMVLQLAYGEVAGTTASASLPTIKRATIPLVTPFEIIDTDLTTELVYVTALSASQPMAKVAIEPAATATFQVITGTTRLAFHSSDAGKAIAYSTPKTRTALPSIGAETVFTTLSNFEFTGLVYADGENYILSIPTMSQINIPTLNVADVTKMDLEYRLTVGDAQRKAFQYYRLTA